MAKFREIGEINPKNEVKSRRRRDFLQNYYKTKVLISTVQGLVNPTSFFPEKTQPMMGKDLCSTVGRERTFTVQP
jgi:hypothetical protein